MAEDSPEQHIADRNPERGADNSGSLVGSGLRLLLPVGALLSAFGLAYAGRQRFIIPLETPLPESWHFNPGFGLTTGDLFLPLSLVFLCLINRRHGPGGTMTALLVTWILLAIAAIWAFWLTGINGAQAPVSGIRAMGVFAGALCTGQLVTIYTFDRLRKTAWWRGPFYSVLLGGFVFTIAFLGQMSLQTEGAWTEIWAAMLGVQVIWACAGLALYGLARPFISPLPGVEGA